MRKMIAAMFLTVLSVGACKTIQQGNLGVERKFGKQNDDLLEPGLYFYNPIWTDIIVLPLTTAKKGSTSKLKCRSSTG
jgi:prohibitin 1